MLTNLQVAILKRLSLGKKPVLGGAAYANQSKLMKQLGAEFLKMVTGKTVIDFGCGDGLEAIELARLGAAAVIGIDIRSEALDRARANALAAGEWGERCEFTKSTTRQADIVITVDAFEHFADPSKVLTEMERLLKPNGQVLACFGPTWYHPRGGHLFSVFPWAHLLFSEEALIRWRSSFKTDGATRFHEVAGGLNQMTIGRFESLVASSPFEFASFEAVPIRNLKFCHNRLTREFTSTVVRCRLVKRTGTPIAQRAHA